MQRIIKREKYNNKKKKKERYPFWQILDYPKNRVELQVDQVGKNALSSKLISIGRQAGGEQAGIP